MHLHSSSFGEEDNRQTRLGKPIGELDIEAPRNPLREAARRGNGRAWNREVAAVAAAECGGQLAALECAVLASPPTLDVARETTGGRRDLETQVAEPDDAGAFSRGREVLGNEPLARNDVIVEEEVSPAGRELDPSIQRCRLARVLDPVESQGQAPPMALQDLESVVGRTVVDDDDLERRARRRLGGKRFETAVEKRCPVISRHDEAEIAHAPASSRSRRPPIVRTMSRNGSPASFAPACRSFAA